MKQAQIIVWLFLIQIFTISAQSPIIPAPVVYQQSVGVLKLEDQLIINSSDFPEEIKDVFIKHLTDQFQIKVIVSPNSGQLEFKKIQNTPKDFYSITIQNESILVQYSSDASCFYAVMSIMQLFEGEIHNWRINNCYIQDYPKYDWRGLHLDVSRHYFTTEEIKRFIDLMSLYKFNTFHWHLTDDQGWRIEIKKYPLLTQVGAFRNEKSQESEGVQNDDVKSYGGFYTQAQIKEIVLYANKRFINIVPEIELPGHARAALSAYPYLSCSGKSLEVPSTGGVFDEIFCTHEQTIDFLKDVLKEVIDLFPSPYIHVGGKDVNLSLWKTCPKCQKVMRENGFSDVHQLQGFFLNKIASFLSENGRQMIAWNDVLDANPIPNSAVMSWDNSESSIKAVNLEKYVVMSPSTYCDFNYYQSKNKGEPLANGGYTPLEKVYDFNPISNSVSKQNEHYILGAQGNLWTEYISDFKKLEYMVFPRALALSQVLWTQTKPEFNSFLKVLNDYQWRFLDRFNINCSKAVLYPQIEVRRKGEGVSVNFKSIIEDQYYDLFTKSDQKTQTMKGGQVIGKNDTLYFERSKGADINNYTFKLMSDLLTSPVIYNLKVHPALGLPLTLKTTPLESLNEKGSITLVDGQYGNPKFKDQNYLGFDAPKVELILDLLNEQIVKSVQIHFLKDVNNSIELPDNIIVYSSKNNRKWKKTKVQFKTNGTDMISNGDFPKCKYIKFIIEAKPKQLTYLDELIVLY